MCTSRTRAALSASRSAENTLSLACFCASYSRSSASLRPAKRCSAYKRMATAEFDCMLPHTTQDTHDPGAPAASTVYLRLQLPGVGF